ncbi:hypothetical protein [Segetibacter aerophilus]|uniref:Uncharacterized protein n=1 Tax=Segetibacter aerophilus TaxID=670293 RepID=A0A512B8M9_9BACT|nr:hypothetical protein [Segetibacter aerophilus]GEO08316.1 hypothetical protein SAE01_08120 [Segetibacter aerophilus]
MANENKEQTAKELLPYVGSFMIFLGVTRLYFYYLMYGIKIVNFLDFSEILTSFLGVIVPFIVSGFVGFFMGFMQRNKVSDERKIALAEQATANVSISKMCLITFQQTKKVMLISLIFGVTFAIVYYLKFQKIEWSILLQAPGFAILMFVIVFIHNSVAHQHNRLNSSNESRRNFGLLLVGMGLVIYTIFDATADAEKVRDKKTNIGTEVLLTDSTTIVSDSFNYYIGKTQNFLFIHHEKKICNRRYTYGKS